MTTPGIMIVTPKHLGGPNQLALEDALKGDVREFADCTVIRTVIITEGTASTVLHGVAHMLDKIRRTEHYRDDQDFAVVVPDEQALFGVEPDMFADEHIHFVDLEMARMAAAASDA